MSGSDTFLQRGWVHFKAEAAMVDWSAAAHSAALRAMADPALDHWWRHGRTWFVGVDALPNDAAGAVPGGPPLGGAAIDFIGSDLGFPGLAWHSAQLSVCREGYPARDDGETEAAHRYRVSRDAAHVDGLHGEGPQKRRFARELHAFILGIPLTDVTAGSSPLTIWEGSHTIMRDAFLSVLEPLPPAQWRDVDLTDHYHAARRLVFETCRKVEITAAPGECYLVHRLALHGVAPWADGAGERIVAYFRPELEKPLDWLSRP